MAERWPRLQIRCVPVAMAGLRLEVDSWWGLSHPYNEGRGLAEREMIPSSDCVRGTAAPRLH